MSEKYEVVVNNVLSGLKQYEDLYSKEYYLEFEAKIANMKERIQESLKEGRILRIGIVGEVKAGKSSFLNALIFDGEDVLPKASTPMTAALTKISYSKESIAKVVFYREREWQNIEQRSMEYDEKLKKLYKEYISKKQSKNPFNIKKDVREQKKEDENMPFRLTNDIKKQLEEKIPMKLKSCKELTELFNKSKLNLRSYLGKTEEIHINNMGRDLQNYVGAEGDFTAIVQHVELKVDSDNLKGIEIVDTPGLNDPIVSRGERTKQFLGECDVVFLLSYTSQFLTQEDISFMCDSLPREGVKEIRIIGSKFDSGLLDDNRSKDIKTAYSSSVAIYNNQAAENIRKSLISSFHKDALEKISSSLPPSYVSSILYSCSRKKEKGIEYSEYEKHIIKQLKFHFSDFTDDRQTLLSLSGINEIRKKMKEIIDRKKEIIADKNRTIVSDNKTVLLDILENINIQVLDNKRQTEVADKEQLENNLHRLQDKLNRMRREVKNIFEATAVEAAVLLNDMKVNIDIDIENHLDFGVESKTDTRYGTRRTGPFGMFRKEYTEVITYNEASVADVTANIRKYIVACKQYINEELKKIINIKKLESTLKDSIIGAFDMSSTEFNENDILIPLSIVINKVTIPDINVEAFQYQGTIENAFTSSVVKNEDIHKLRMIEEKVLQEIAYKIKEEIDETRDKINNIMGELSASFVDDIIKNLTSNIDRLKKQIEDREHFIQKYSELSDNLLNYKQLVKEMEI